MIRKYDITFVEAARPISEPVTKFGGQPVWIEEPQWPMSRQTGEQMQFICQVTLDVEVFRVPPGKVAYLFMTGGLEGHHVDRTWESEGGENAVLVQPSAGLPYDGRLETAPLATGPTLYRFQEEPGGSRMKPVPCEYAVELIPGEDREPVSEEEQAGWDDDTHDAYFDSLVGNKIGGTPLFIQGEEYPTNGPWRLLLQLEMMELPFFVNFGDAGSGYSFISVDGEKGRFLWQCY